MQKKDEINTTSLVGGVAYASPCIVTLCLFAPINIVQGIYAKHYGVALTTIASIILISRLFDAFSDPVIGMLSDRYYVRFGSRKPFCILGAGLLAFSSLFLYIPPETVSSTYFLVWSIAFYAAFTFFEVPHITWGGELASCSNEKTKIYSLRTMASYIGLALFYCLPLFPIFETTDVTPETLKWSVLLAISLMFPLMIFCVYKAPDGKSKSNRKAIETISIRSNIRVVLGNKPLCVLLTSYLFLGMSSGMWYGLIFIYVDVYLGLGEEFTKVFLVAFLVGVCAAGVWYKVGGWFGRKTALILSCLCAIASYLITGWLTPPQSSFIALLLVKILSTVSFSGQDILTKSILSDIADYGRWKYSVNRGGTYFSLYTFASKANMAIGAAIGLTVTGFYGFNPAETTHSDNSIYGLKIAIAWLPASFALLSMLPISFLTISRRRHSIVLRRLNGAR